MKAELRAGATVEFLDKHELAEVMNAHAKMIARALRVKPTGVILRAMAIGVGGLAVIDFGSPAMGFEWEVRRYFVTGQDPTVVIAGSAATVLVAESADVATPFDTVDTTATGSVATIPNKGAWTDDQLVVGFGQHLLIRCSGIGVASVFANAYVFQRSATQEETPELVIPVSANGDALATNKV